MESAGCFGAGYFYIGSGLRVIGGARRTTVGSVVKTYSHKFGSNQGPELGFAIT